jgi:hypothetical protein
MWSERASAYTLQAYKYFNGVKMLTDMQDNYAEYMQKVFPSLQRGIKGSKAKHISMKTLHQLNSEASEETDIEDLKVKAANQEYLKKKVNYMDKTLKSMEYFNKHDREELDRLKKENKDMEYLKKENQELKKDIEQIKAMLGLDNKEVLEQSQNNDRSTKRGFSGKRYK